MGIIPDLIVVSDKRITPGVLAGRTFNPGNRILELDGDLIAANEMQAAPYIERGIIQVGPEMFLKIELSNPARHMKHSCDPNAGLVFKGDGRVELVAIAHIKPMEEIAWDYCTTISCLEGKSFDCACLKPGCRKKFGNYELLPWEVRRHYEYLGIVAPYLAPQTVLR